jgi:hypothetical protein
VPDFDQRWDNWGKVFGIQDPSDPLNNPDNPEWRWTWDGPVAWANSIWWMDSRFESYFNPFAVPPPAISDSFPLIYSPDPAYDDHHPDNVQNVAQELWQIFQTDGGQIFWCQWNGTHIADMISGLRMGLDMLGLGKQSHLWPGPYFVVEAREYPAFYEIVREVQRCQDVVLLLGFYEENRQVPGEYIRWGGHYVTVVAVSDEQMQIRVSDPFLDISNPGPLPTDHLDAAVVSHDQYQAQSLFPLGCSLVDYPWSIGAPGDPVWESLQQFKDVNPTNLNYAFTTQPGMGFLTLVEYMVHLSPEWDTDVYEKPGYVDYAPAGVPDFDQRQDNWGKVPGNPDGTPQDPGWQWTWCGPVALANSLWWIRGWRRLFCANRGRTPFRPGKACRTIFCW